MSANLVDSIMEPIYIGLSQMFGVTTLRYRESGREVADSIPKGDTPIIIDFANIDFASHSFLSELMGCLHGRDVTYNNRPEFVVELMNIIEKRIYNHVGV